MANHDDLLRQFIKEHLEQQLIYESLTFSYPVSTVNRKLIENNYDSVYNGKTINIKFILSKDNQKRYDELNDFMDKTCGWHHGASIADGGSVMKNKLEFLDTYNGSLFLQFEPKFDIEVSNIPKIIYHLTTLNKLNKILEIGLAPKSSNNFFSFTDRIYFSKDIKSLYSFAFKKLEVIKKIEKEKKNSDIKNDNIKDKNKFVILQIKTDYRTRFFEDPNFENGFYTLENINRFSIKPIEEIELDDNGNIIKTEKL